MAFNIADWASYIGDTGVLQTNKYDVSIYLQGEMARTQISDIYGNPQDSAVGISEDLTYRCINASIPGMTMRTTDVNRMGIGVMEKMPYSANYTDISLTFLMDRYGAAYNFWYTWFNYIFGINGYETNSNIYGSIGGRNNRSFYTAAYKEDYSATVNITVYDNMGVPSLQTTLFSAYPTSINDIALNWTDNNNLIKLTTNLTFREWQLGDGIGGVNAISFGNNNNSRIITTR